MLPIIDFHEFRQGDAQSRSRVAQSIGRNLQEIGFFLVRNHGIDADVIKRAQEASQAFFSQSLDCKRAVARPSGQYRGYIEPIPFATKNKQPNRPPILYEAFILGQPDQRDETSLRWPTPWPTQSQEFHTAIADYWSAADALAMELMRAFALALALDEETFTSHFTRPLSNMSLLHYLARQPLQVEDGDEQGDDVPPHFDKNAVTIVLPDKVGGLEVLGRDGQWITETPDDESLVVNIGNIMESWSGGRFKSTLHRVQPPLGKDRYSIAHFATPDFETLVTPLVEPPLGEVPPEAIHAGRNFGEFVALFD